MSGAFGQGDIQRDPGRILTAFKGRALNQLPVVPNIQNDMIIERRGDFAIVGVVVVADTLRWTIVVYGAGEKPSRFAIDEDLRVTAFRDVASRVANDTSTRSDLHASAEFRKELVEVLTRRALEEALNDES